jgi:hypothetical protein
MERNKFITKKANKKVVQKRNKSNKNINIYVWKKMKK